MIHENPHLRAVAREQELVTLEIAVERMELPPMLHIDRKSRLWMVEE